MKYRLMVPGPTPLPPEVTAAAIAPMVDERTPEYAAVFTRVIDNLKQVMLTDNSVLIFTSSMTGAFEGALQNLLSAGDHILVATNGGFGDRWAEMCRAFGLQVTEVRAPWGTAIDMTEVARAVTTEPDIAVAICVHCETTTGVVNDIRAFAQACGDAITVVDSASGLGACELRVDDWGVDVVVAGGQKALMTPPGIAFASISDRAWRCHERATLPRYYFDWTHALRAYRSDVPRTPWTPAISLLNQLDVALRHILDEGLAEVLRRHTRLGQMARAGVQTMGLELFSTGTKASSSVTAVRVPEGIDGDVLVRHVFERYGVQLVGGAGPLAGRVLRIGHCGYVDAFDVLNALVALELTLDALGYPVGIGEGVAAAVRVWAEHSADHMLRENGLPTTA